MADKESDDEETGDDPSEEDEGGSSDGTSSKKRLFLIIGVALLLILGGAGAAYFTGMLEPLMSAESDAGHDAGKDATKSATKSTEVVFFDIPELLVNLSSPAGRKSSYLKIRVSLELGSHEDVKTVETVMPRIIDNFQVYLRELRIDDLKGSPGMYRLREELLTRVNAAVAPARVNDVLFKDMLVQ